MINLMLGDCLDKLDTIPDASVDMVLADPPYGTTRCKWDSIIPLDQLWPKIVRVLKPKGVVVMTAQTPFDKILGCSNLPWLRYEWIWEKTNATGHLNAKRSPMKAHENVLVFYKNLGTYNPQMTKGHPPINSYRKKKDSDGDCYGSTSEVRGGGSTSRYPRSVQVFKSDTQKCKLHPTQKPLELMRFLVRTYTNPDDTVLDFCMGSGTTGLAARIESRKFIGIEKDHNYFKIAENRITGEHHEAVPFTV